MPINETCLKVKLGNEDRVLTFNANTMVAFEEATGVFYLDAVASLYDAMYPVVEKRAKEKEREKQESGNADSSTELISNLEIARKVPIKILRAMIWAACHEYKNDEPYWPLTLAQVGRRMSFQDIAPLFRDFLRGQAQNSPTKEEMGESLAQSATEVGTVLRPVTADIGGERSIAVPEDAFTLAEAK